MWEVIHNVTTRYSQQQEYKQKDFYRKKGCEKLRQITHIYDPIVNNKEFLNFYKVKEGWKEQRQLFRRPSDIRKHKRKETKNVNKT